MESFASDAPLVPVDSLAGVHPRTMRCEVIGRLASEICIEICNLGYIAIPVSRAQAQQMLGQTVIDPYAIASTIKSLRASRCRCLSRSRLMR